MKIVYVVLIATAVLGGCTGSSIKEKINKAGDVAGQTAGEFVEGISDGVQKAFDVDISMGESLKNKGIEFGKSTVSSDSEGWDNQLNLYVIYNKDFNGDLIAKVYDKKGKEMGRSIAKVKGSKNEAGFVLFQFDKNTNIDSKNKIIIDYGA